MKEELLPDYTHLIDQIHSGEVRDLPEQLEAFWADMQPVMTSDFQTAAHHLAQFATAATERSADSDTLSAALNEAYLDFVRMLYTTDQISLLKEHYLSFCQKIITCFDRHSSDSGFQRITEIQSYLQAHLDEDLSLKSISEQFYLNSAYLSRLFREKTGMTFSDYLAEQRISRAKDLLITTSQSVLMIAKSVGYQEANSFSRLFKKHTGKSPQKFRSDNRTTLQDSIPIFDGAFDMGPCVFASEDLDYADSFLRRDP